MKEKKEKPAKKAAKTEIPNGVKVSKEFVFKLTDEEARKRLASAGALHMEIQKLQEEFKEVKGHWNEKIKARTDARDAILVAGETGEESRVVDAIMVKDYDTKQIHYYVDGEIKESRTMTPEELQMDMTETGSVKRGKRQKIKDSTSNLSGMTAKGEEDEIGNVIKMETNKRTKRSAVDGAVTETAEQ